MGVSLFVHVSDNSDFGMPLLQDISELPERGCLLALDNGRKRIGVAISDKEQRVSVPLSMVERFGSLGPVVEEVCRLSESRGVAGFVMGLPLNMDGSAGSAVQSARAFAFRLLCARDLPLVFFDERLSSVEAERALRACGVSRLSRRRLVDSAAAALILRAALDSRRRC